MKLSVIGAAGVLCLAALCGCSANRPSGTPDVVTYGNDAAAVTRARIALIREEIGLIERQKREALEDREALNKDAREYRKRSSAAWTDPALTDRQRAPIARQYLQLARNLEGQAATYSERAKAFDDRIAELEGLRHDLRRHLEYLKDQEIAAPK